MGPEAQHSLIAMSTGSTGRWEGGPGCLSAPFWQPLGFIISIISIIDSGAGRGADDKNYKNDETVGRPEWTHKACKTTQIHTRRGAKIIKMIK